MECENYLGNSGDLSTSSGVKKSSRERVDFYYKSVSQSFWLGIRLSEGEISKYEENEARLEISANRDEKPFEYLSINTRNFAPDDLFLVPLTKYSSAYYVLNTFVSEKREHRLFNNREQPIFLKILGNDDHFRAKLIKSNTLFTNTRYYVVYQKRDTLPVGLRNHKEISVSEKKLFTTMDKEFYGAIFTIENETDYAYDLLDSFGYELRTSKRFTLLWPPARLLNDEYMVSGDEVYAHTSLTLCSLENTSLLDSEINKISNSTYKLTIESAARIVQDNVDLTINRDRMPETTWHQIPLFEKSCDRFVVDGNGEYYLFNRSGVRQLFDGETVFLGTESLIKCYRNSYLVKVICPNPSHEISIENRIRDILMYYKYEEPFNADSFDSVGFDKSFSHYLDSCRKSGFINKAVKHYILEGHNELSF